MNDTEDRDAGGDLEYTFIGCSLYVRADVAEHDRQAAIEQALAELKREIERLKDRLEQEDEAFLDSGESEDTPELEALARESIARQERDNARIAHLKALEDRDAALAEIEQLKAKLDEAIDPVAWARCHGWRPDCTMCKHRLTRPEDPPCSTCAPWYRSNWEAEAEDLAT